MLLSNRKTECVESRERSISLRHAAGFTLVELLVVIGIIALLISVLLPALARARAHANLVKCMANLRSLGQAMNIYVANNKGALPFGFCGGSTATVGPLPTHKYDPNDPADSLGLLDWDTLLLSALNPKFSTRYKQLQTDGQLFTGGYQGARAFVVCPEVDTNLLPTTPGLVIHYSAHPRIFPDLSGTDWPAAVAKQSFTPPLPLRLGYPASKVKRSSEMVGFMDGSIYSRGGVWTTSACAYALDKARVEAQSLMPNTFLTDWYAMPVFNVGTPITPNDPVDMTPSGNITPNPNAKWNSDTPENWGNIRFRHLGEKAANVLMMDGHVQTFYYNATTKTTDLLRKNINVNP